MIKFPGFPFLYINIWLPALGLTIGLAAVSSMISGVDASIVSSPWQDNSDGTAVKLEQNPATPWVKVGEKISYDIYAVPESAGTAAIELHLNYGSDLELVEVKPGPYLGPHPIPGPNFINPNQGEALQIWARVGPTPSPAEPGVLASVTFRAISDRPWNTWVRQTVKLVDGELQGFQQIEYNFNVNVYDRLPVPRGIYPGAESSPGNIRTGPHATFRIRTLAPAAVKYRIEISQDNFQSVALTLDQTLSQAGWDREEYRNGQQAEFILPQSMKPGEYQWRAYAWIAELDQWSEAGDPLPFEVVREPIGISRVSPPVISNSGDDQRRVAIEGWGFSPGTSATLWTHQGESTPLTVEYYSNGKLGVVIPDGIKGGLAWLQLSTEVWDGATSPLLIMPASLYAVKAEVSSRSNQVIPGQPLDAYIRSQDWGTDDDTVALVKVTLPDSTVFQLVGIKPAYGVELLEWNQHDVLLAMAGNTLSPFEFRLLPDLVEVTGANEKGFVSPGDSLDFTLKPVIVGEVSRARWEQLSTSNTLSALKLAVRAETNARLEPVARSFNDLPLEDLERYLPVLLARGESHKVVHLITRTQDSGADMSKFFAAVSHMSGATQKRVAREHWYATGVSIKQIDMWVDGEIPLQNNANCCPGLSSGKGIKLEVVTSEDASGLLSEPEGFGAAAYIANDQSINFRVRVENPSEDRETASDVIVVAQVGNDIDSSSLLLDTSSRSKVTSTDINDSNSTVTWRLKSTTPPRDRGDQSWIGFSARPKESAASGNTITVKSAVRLGLNPPIETNEVVYTIDAGPPDSRVKNLAPVQLSPAFQVLWTGSDDTLGSGLQGVTLLVSTDGEPFEVAGIYTESPIFFQADVGKTYGFATVAVDNVGNLETMPQTPDTSVTVGQHLAMDGGWHLVGVPVITGQTPRDELARPGTHWSTWDTLRQAYQTGDGADARWLANSQELPGAGLWANFEAGTNFYITGESPALDRAFTIELAEGWNLIANPFPLPVAWSLDNIRVRVGGTEKNLAEAQAQGWVEDFAWGWDENSYFLVYDSRLSAKASGLLEPFKGYWVLAHDNVTLVLPPPDFSLD